MLSEYAGEVTLTVGLQTARRAVETVHPDLSLSGHLSGAYTLQIGSAAGVRVDSSQQERYNALIDPERSIIRICNDSGNVRVPFRSY